jgi:hypothetical protein
MDEAIDRLDERAFDFQFLVGLAEKVAECEDTALQQKFWLFVYDLSGEYIPFDHLWAVCGSIKEYSETAIRAFLGCGASLRTKKAASFTTHLASHLNLAQRRALISSHGNLPILRAAGVHGVAAAL